MLSDSDENRLEKLIVKNYSHFDLQVPFKTINDFFDNITSKEDYSEYFFASFTRLITEVILTITENSTQLEQNFLTALIQACENSANVTALVSQNGEHHIFERSQSHGTNVASSSKIALPTVSDSHEVAFSSKSQTDTQNGNDQLAAANNKINNMYNQSVTLLSDALAQEIIGYLAFLESIGKLWFKKLTVLISKLKNSINSKTKSRTFTSSFSEESENCFYQLICLKKVIAESLATLTELMNENSTSLIYDNKSVFTFYIEKLSVQTNVVNLCLDAFIKAINYDINDPVIMYVLCFINLINEGLYYDQLAYSYDDHQNKFKNFLTNMNQSFYTSLIELLTIRENELSSSLFHICNKCLAWLTKDELYLQNFLGYLKTNGKFIEFINRVYQNINGPYALNKNRKLTVSLVSLLASLLCDKVVLEELSIIENGNKQNITLATLSECLIKSLGNLKNLVITSIFNNNQVSKEFCTIVNESLSVILSCTEGIIGWGGVKSDTCGTSNFITYLLLPQDGSDTLVDMLYSCLINIFSIFNEQVSLESIKDNRLTNILLANTKTSLFKSIVIFGSRLYLSRQSIFDQLVTFCTNYIVHDDWWLGIVQLLQSNIALADEVTQTFVIDQAESISQVLSDELQAYKNRATIRALCFVLLLCSPNHQASAVSLYLRVIINSCTRILNSFSGNDSLTVSTNFTTPNNQHEAVLNFSNYSERLENLHFLILCSFYLSASYLSCKQDNLLFWGSIQYIVDGKQLLNYCFESGSFFLRDIAVLIVCAAAICLKKEQKSDLKVVMRSYNRLTVTTQLTEIVQSKSFIKAYRDCDHYDLYLRQRNMIFEETPESFSDYHRKIYLSMNQCLKRLVSNCDQSAFELTEITLIPTKECLITFESVLGNLFLHFWRQTRTDESFLNFIDTIETELKLDSIIDKYAETKSILEKALLPFYITIGKLSSENLALKSELADLTAGLCQDQTAFKADSYQLLYDNTHEDIDHTNNNPYKITNRLVNFLSPSSSSNLKSDDRTVKSRSTYSENMAVLPNYTHNVRNDLKKLPELELHQLNKEVIAIDHTLLDMNKSEDVSALITFIHNQFLSLLNIKDSHHCSLASKFTRQAIPLKHNVYGTLELLFVFLTELIPKTDSTADLDSKKRPDSPMSLGLTDEKKESGFLSKLKNVIKQKYNVIGNEQNTETSNLLTPQKGFEVKTTNSPIISAKPSDIKLIKINDPVTNNLIVDSQLDTVFPPGFLYETGSNPAVYSSVNLSNTYKTYHNDGSIEAYSSVNNQQSTEPVDYGAPPMFYGTVNNDVSYGAEEILHHTEPSTDNPSHLNVNEDNSLMNHTQLNLQQYNIVANNGNGYYNTEITDTTQNVNPLPIRLVNIQLNHNSNTAFTSENSVVLADGQQNVEQNGFFLNQFCDTQTNDHNAIPFNDFNNQNKGLTNESINYTSQVYVDPSLQPNPSAYNTEQIGIAFNGLEQNDKSLLDVTQDNLTANVKIHDYDLAADDESLLSSNHFFYLLINQQAKQHQNADAADSEYTTSLIATNQHDSVTAGQPYISETKNEASSLTNELVHVDNASPIGTQDMMTNEQTSENDFNASAELSFMSINDGITRTDDVNANLAYNNSISANVLAPELSSLKMINKFTSQNNGILHYASCNCKDYSAMTEPNKQLSITNSISTDKCIINDRTDTLNQVDEVNTGPLLLHNESASLAENIKQNINSIVNDNNNLNKQIAIESQHNDTNTVFSSILPEQVTVALSNKYTAHNTISDLSMSPSLVIIDNNLITQRANQLNRKQINNTVTRQVDQINPLDASLPFQDTDNTPGAKQTAHRQESLQLTNVQSSFISDKTQQFSPLSSQHKLPYHVPANNNISHISRINITSRIDSMDDNYSRNSSDDNSANANSFFIQSNAEKQQLSSPITSHADLLSQSETKNEFCSVDQAFNSQTFAAGLLKLNTVNSFQASTTVDNKSKKSTALQMKCAVDCPFNF